MDHKIGSGARCAMIGYGSWATALAKVLTENEPSIGWYVRNPEVLESLRNKGVPKAEREAKARALLESCGLPATFLARYPHQVSGGQCQRLVIARALLRSDSAVYIFDEAASNIDVESEEMIMNVIHELAKTKTVLLISHRLANVVQSDQIYFLKNGTICERGTHAELMEQNGAYRHLYDSQMVLENYGKQGNA